MSGPRFRNYFKLIKELGRGTFGMVVSAIDLKNNNNRCAIKVKSIYSMIFYTKQHI